MSGEIPRLEGEPGRWYARFVDYLAQPPGKRSVLEVYRLEKARKGATSIPGAWRVAVDRFQWRERAQAFDDQQAREEMTRFADLRRRESEKRFRLFRRARRTLDRVLQSLGNPQNVGRWSPGDLLRGLGILAALEREQPAVNILAENETPDGYIALIRSAMSTGYLAGFGAGLPEELAKDQEESESDDDR